MNKITTIIWLSIIFNLVKLYSYHDVELNNHLEFSNDSVYCLLKYGIQNNVMTINIYASNNFNKNNFELLTKSKQFIESLNTGEHFLEEETGDTLYLDQYYFKNNKGNLEFVIAVENLSKKAFIFNIQNKRLKKIGYIGMLERIIKDTSKVECNLIGNPKKIEVGYSRIEKESNENDVPKFNKISVVFLNDISISIELRNSELKEVVYKNNKLKEVNPKNKVVKEFFNVYNKDCGYLNTFLSNGKIKRRIFYDSIFIGEDKKLIIKSPINIIKSNSSYKYYKYSGSFYNYYFYISDYSNLILENIITNEISCFRLSEIYSD